MASLTESKINKEIKKDDRRNALLISNYQRYTLKEQEKGRLVWLMKYAILSLKMWFIMNVYPFKNRSKRVLAWCDLFDERCMYKHFLKGFRLGYLNPNEAW